MQSTKPGPASILVVEDDEPIRLALRELLESEGYDVVVACDGLEALGVLVSVIPALVLTDLQMPNLDGAELCLRLRASASTANVPIIALTAARHLTAIEGRVDAVVRKPFDIDELLQVIAQYIRPTVPPRASMMHSLHESLAPAERHALVLYVTPGSSACERARSTLDAFLASEVPPATRPSVEVVDVATDPARAMRDGVSMTPTLIRNLTDRRDLYLGDLSDGRLLRAFLMRE